MGYSVDITSGKTASASSNAGSGWEASRAIDDGLTYGWASASGPSFPQWLKIDLGEESLTDLTSGMTASADSTAGAGWVASKAIDDSNTTGWSSDLTTYPHWLKIDFGSSNEKTITAFSIRARNDAYAERAPKDFKLQGSNNNSDWTDLSTQTGITFLVAQRLCFSFTNSTAYRYYRMYATASAEGNGTFYCQIYEFELAESYDFSARLAIAQYTLQAMATNNADLPKDFTFQGSNSNTWTTIDTRTAQTFTASEKKTYNSFTNSTPYRYYRINATAYNGSSGYVRIGELELMYLSDETLDTADSLSLGDSWSEQITPDNQATSDSLSLDDSWLEQITPDSQILSDTLSLDDLWNIHISNEELFADDSLSLDDSWSALITPDNQATSDSLTLDDVWSAYVDLEAAVLGDSLSLSDTWSEVMSGTFSIKIATKFTWLETVKDKISTSFSWLLAKSISTDFRWMSVSTKQVATDFRWLAAPYVGLSPIDYTDIQIFINSVDMVLANDVDIQTGNITHTSGSKSIATFTLARKHDDLDRTHTGTASQITNQNPVQIYIKGNLEFDGKISNLSVNSESETVQVTCLMNEPADNRHSIELPLPSVNEKLHLYHCLVNNVQIDNPYIDPGELNPDYYKGVTVDLGTQITQQTDTYREIEATVNGKGRIATEVEEGTYETKPNYSYFWAVLVKNVKTGLQNGLYNYIGTSLAQTTTDLWAIMGASPIRQKIKDNIETELGFYNLGSAPYKEISCKNGKLIIAAKYQDRNDGLYHVYDNNYDYIDYAKRIAALEYEKLKNVDGGILPITFANIEITFDAYYYYTVKLLTRINVTNTTVANTYKNNNGFPTSVKGITINFSTMKITLNTDNRLSQEELTEIDAQKPNEDDYVVEERVVRVYRKFDLKTWKYVS